jgi:hypothetical protein
MQPLVVPMVICVCWCTIYTYAHQLAALFLSLLHAIVVTLTQSLPVPLIPEEDGISLVRLDVVHNRGCCQLPVRLAHPAARMPSEIQLSGFAPSPPIKADLASAHNGSSFFKVALRYTDRSAIHSRTIPIRIPIMSVIVVSA